MCIYGTWIRMWVVENARDAFLFDKFSCCKGARQKDCLYTYIRSLIAFLITKLRALLLLLAEYTTILLDFQTIGNPFSGTMNIAHEPQSERIIISRTISEKSKPFTHPIDAYAQSNIPPTPSAIDKPTQVFFEYLRKFYYRLWPMQFPHGSLAKLNN